MKKKLLTILSLLLLSLVVSYTEAKAAGADLTNAIKLYKAGNYSESYTNLCQIVKKDSANALAYYYLAMSAAQVGKREEAISNYEKSMALSPQNTKLYRYATKGKVCLETPDKCDSALYDSPIDAFIQNKTGARVSDEVKSGYEKLKIENLMREINRSSDIEPQRFKEYRDFSSMNNESMPTNDEIVAALRTLQKAGLNSYTNSFNDISLMTDNNKQDVLLNMMGNSSVNPQVIQSLLMNSMSTGF